LVIIFSFAFVKACQKVIALFMLAGILANSFNHWVILTSYTLNKSYISSVLCTNKDKPGLHCEGKCFMDIKLKELAQKNKQDLEQLKRMAETVIPDQQLLPEPCFEYHFTQHNCISVVKKPIDQSAFIFHPPKQA